MSTKRNLDTITAAFKAHEGIDLGADDANCGCGCGAETKKNRRFLQGHDRRFIAMAVNMELVDAKIELFTNSGSKGEFTGTELAQRLLTDAGMQMFGHHLAAAENPAKRPSRARAPKAEAPAEETGPQMPTEPIEVKIGRWVKTAWVTEIDAEGTPTEVRYEKADGSEEFTRKFKLTW